MKTKWLVQSSGFAQTNVLEVFETLNQLNFTVQDFGLIPFTNTITNLENILEKDTKYILKAGTKILTILNEIENISESNSMLSKEQIELSDIYLAELKKSIDYNIEKFDLTYYSKLNLPLLNSNADYIEFNKIKDKIFTDDMFIKPSRDLKAFNGGIIEKGISVNDFIMNNYPQSYYKNEIIIISDLIKIYTEYRFFIIEDKVITGSLYKRGNNVVYDSIIPNYIMEKAIEYAKLYKPADIFVMDLAETDNGIKIIEYNCWNASGLYYCDVKKLFNEINEYKLNN